MIASLPALKSRHVSSRRVDVWQPEAIPPGTRLPVLYMHDGQNLFDPATAYGGITWGIGEAVSRLVAAGRIRPCLVVGIWNTDRRWREYMPARPIRGPAAAPVRLQFALKAGGLPLSDRYLAFLVEELKPLIDRQYPTLPDLSATFIMGSSMGGLISLYALCRYPQVFSGAACLSTHWPAGGELLVSGLGALLPPPGKHKLYFDYGTATLDAEYEPFQLQMDEFLQARGYVRGTDWLTLKFEGAEHNEAAWCSRVHIPLEFLLSTCPL